MKNKYLNFFIILLIILINFQGLNAKPGPSIPITLANQAAIDAFSSNYPGITSISGDLLIGDFSSACIQTDITNLNGLLQIASVSGNIKIHKTILTNLTGLNNLQSVNGFIALTDNSVLESIDGLEGLNTLGGFIIGFDNYNLTDIDALLNLSYIGGDVVIYSDGFTELNGFSNITSIAGSLSIACNGLLNLDAFSNLSNIDGNLTLDENYSLLDINGLSSLVSVNGNLHISNNYSLNNLDGLSSLASINGCIFINNNVNLVSIEGLAGINSATIDYKNDFDPPGQDIMIKYNPQLSVCDVLSICTALGLPGTTYSIEGNAPGCLEGALNCTGVICTGLTYPANGSDNIPVNSTLTWANSLNATGYKISIGLTPSGSEIIDSLDIGNSLTYTPLTYLPCGTKIYVRIMPYRNNGEAAGCIEESFLTESVIASVNEHREICSGTPTLLSSSGGNNYHWYPDTGLNDPYIQNPVASPLVSTSYTVTVSNMRGCSDTAMTVVNVNIPPVPNASGIAESGNNFNNGVALANPSGGKSPYNYLWSNGKNTKTILNLNPGEYIVTVTDANYCSSIDTVMIDEFICPELELISQIKDISCFNVCDGSIAILNVNNSSTPISYLWNTGSDSISIKNLCAGNYSIAISDAKNCSLNESFVLIQPSEMIISVDSVQNLSGTRKGFILISTNNTATCKYIWTGPNNFMSTDKDIFNLEAGCYSLVISDTLSNCETDTTICISDLTSSQSQYTVQDISVYPNPAKDLFWIDLANIQLSETEIKIYDISGKNQVYEINGIISPLVRIDTMNLDSGIYVIRIKKDSHFEFRKLIVIK